MFGIPAEHIVPIANFIGIGILGVVAYFGQRWGKSQPTAVDKTVEVAGALVDAESVKHLTAAIEGQTLEFMEQRRDAEKTRKIGHELVETLDRFVGEMQELRRSASDVAREIARKK